MSARRIRQQGFTLVEILIVVVILGILAAIVIPQFTSASETAKASSLTSQLQTIRSQLELYQVQHNGNYPSLSTLPTGASTFWDQFTEYSDSSGECYGNTKPTDGTVVYGPYLQKPPANPLAIASLTDNTTVGDEDATNTAWSYDESNGRIKAVLDAKITTEKAEDMGLDIVNDVKVTASSGS